jgi:hypothetical protein
MSVWLKQQDWLEASERNLAEAKAQNNLTLLHEATSPAELSSLFLFYIIFRT